MFCESFHIKTIEFELEHKRLCEPNKIFFCEWARICLSIATPALVRFFEGHVKGRSILRVKTVIGLQLLAERLNKL